MAVRSTTTKSSLAATGYFYLLLTQAAAIVHVLSTLVLQAEAIGVMDLSNLPTKWRCPDHCPDTEDDITLRLVSSEA
jgi:hypothetical protein